MLTPGIVTYCLRHGMKNIDILIASFGEMKIASICRTIAFIFCITLRDVMFKDSEFKSTGEPQFAPGQRTDAT